MFENIHDDWCECWKSGPAGPDYSKCDCHILSIKRLQEIIERGTEANFKQEAKIQELSIKLQFAHERLNRLEDRPSDSQSDNLGSIPS